MNRMNSFRCLLPGAFALLAGCATVEPHLMPTPALYKDPQLDFFPALPPALRSTRLPVFYATTRAPAADGEPGHYINADGDGVRLGVAQVRLGEPAWSWNDLVASDLGNTIEKPRFGEVEHVDEFGKAGAPDAAERRFLAAIDAQLARSQNKELVFYVHGYRVQFDEVAVQMGSFAHYLGHGAMVTFQWPTGMNFWNYVTDCPRAERYIPDIEATLALLARSSATRINILAYSCGSPLLAAALSKLRARQPAEGRAQLSERYRIGNVIFVASDVDLKTFASEYVPPILDLAQQLIVYASRNDRALGFSSLIAGASRLGRPDIADLTPGELDRLAADPRLQVIEVSDVRGAHEMGGMRGHGYWYANDWISSDITLSLRHAIPPAQRCLVNTPDSPRVWRMPDGYLQCLSGRLRAAFPVLRKTTQ
ncbi:MAG: alpha/beta hydrolase [Burkholderiales bacterium]